MKNWFVSVEQKKRSGKVSERTKKRNEAKGIENKKANRNTLENSVKYLLNDKHNNHRLTEITDLGNARLTKEYIFDAYNDMKEKHSKGTSNIASSFVLSMPSDLYHPTTDEWREISDLTIKNFVDEVNIDLAKKEKAHHKKSTSKMSERQLKEYHLNTDRFAQRLDLDEVKKLSTSVIHDDRNKPLIVGATAGSHLNIVMSNIFNGDVMKYISQLGGAFSMKTAYSNAVKEKLGLDCDLYIPYSLRPDNEKLKNFYSGETNHLNIVEVNENTPHKNKIIGPVPEDEKDKPFWLAKKEQSILLQAEKDKIEELEKDFKTEKNNKIREINSSSQKIKKAINEVKKARKEIKSDQENIRDERVNISFEKKEIDYKNDKLKKENEKLDRKETAIEKAISLFKSTQETFKSWMISLHSTQKKELEKLAIASANKIVELEKDAPNQANVLYKLAEREEDQASLLCELREKTKVTHQVKLKKQSNRSKNRFN